MQITMRRQRKLLHRLVFLLLAIPLLGLASVQAESKASLWPSTLARQTEEPVKASLHADDAKAAAPTKAAVPARVWLGLRLEHQPGWHTYWINPGDSGLASRIEWTLPSGWTAPQAYWPMPKRIPVGPLMNFGYEGALWVPLALDVPANSPAGTYRVKARVHWLMCSDVCIPGEASLGAELRLPEQRLRQPDPSHRASVSSNESALASDKAQAAESSLGAFASNPPGLPALREALMRVPHKAMNMRYSRDGDRIVLRPDQAGEALLVGAEGGRFKGLEASYFPEQAGWMLNSAAQRIEVDEKGGWMLSLVADKSFNDELLIDGYLRVGQQAFRVLGPRTQSLPNPSGAPPSQTLEAATTAGFSDRGLLVLLLMALIGGLLLNAMPCVFPVIGIKLLSLVPRTSDEQGLRASGSSTTSQAQASDARADIEHGVRKAALLYGLGVVLSFWALGLIVVLLQAGGNSIGWGFQLQEPLFVLAMFWLFLLIGANLLGLFEVGSGFMRWAGQAEVGALGSGVLAVLVATPCTAPMMGAALGASLSQGPMQAMAVFTALAFGMALPYGALVLRPQWIHRLPRPGPWMLWTRKALAFPMFLAAVWLAWVFVLQTDAESVLQLGFSAVLLLCSSWLFGERVQTGWLKSEGRPWSSTFSLLLLIGGLALPFATGLRPGTDLSDKVTDKSLPGSGQQAWSNWSPEAVDEALGRDEIVFVDFTAAWCVSCQVNKQLVLSTPDLQALFEQYKVRSFRGDWTRQDARITQTLARYGRRGVPLYLVLRSGREPQILPEVLSYGLVRDAVLAAAAP